MSILPEFWPQTLAQLTQWAQVSLVPILLVSATAAIVQLRKNALQARATFLLELETKWDRIEGSRKRARVIEDAVRKDVFSRHSNKKDSEQEKLLREAYADYLRDLKASEPESFTELSEYWGFHETLGLMVRKGYVPFKDAYLLYKGPLIEIDRACSRFVDEWQKEAHIPPGLYENMLYLARRATRRERREQKLSGLKFRV